MILSPRCSALYASHPPIIAPAPNPSVLLSLFTCGEYYVIEAIFQLSLLLQTLHLDIYVTAHPIDTQALTFFVCISMC